MTYWFYNNMIVYLHLFFDMKKLLGFYCKNTQIKLHENLSIDYKSFFASNLK